MGESQPKEPTKRERSPKFPYIGLNKAIERIKALYNKAKRYETRVADIAKDWDLSPKSSSTDRTVAALQSFGLIEDSGAGDARKIKITELGARILADTRPGVQDTLLAEVALKPPIIAEWARRWSDGRPDDSHSISQLVFEGNFTDEGARMFLRVFDETMRFVSGKLDKAPSDDGYASASDEREDVQAEAVPSNPPTYTASNIVQKEMQGEREWLRGPLSKHTGYRLLVTGSPGPKEIGKLIKLLEAQKLVLDDDDDEGDDN